MDADDIRQLPRDRAIECYRTRFWERYQYDQIGDQSIGTKVFDLCVNTGARQAHLCTQRALLACSIAVVEDGVLGPLTFAAINRAPPLAMLAALRSEAASFYRVLTTQKPELTPFLAGWLRRAYA